jgi:hypothetical protein
MGIPLHASVFHWNQRQGAYTCALVSYGFSVQHCWDFSASVFFLSFFLNKRLHEKKIKSCYSCNLNPELYRLHQEFNSSSKGLKPIKLGWMGFLIKSESKVATTLHRCFLNGWPRNSSRHSCAHSEQWYYTSDLSELYMTFCR